MKRKVSPALLIVLLAFAFVFGFALIARGSLTGSSVAPIAINNGTVLSAIAAVLAIGVLLVAALQQRRKKK